MLYYIFIGILTTLIYLLIKILYTAWFISRTSRNLTSRMREYEAYGEALIECNPSKLHSHDLEFVLSYVQSVESLLEGASSENWIVRRISSNVLQESKYMKLVDSLSELVQGEEDV